VIADPLASSPPAQVKDTRPGRASPSIVVNAGAPLCERYVSNVASPSKGTFTTL